MKFDLQKFARDYQDTLFRGRRRFSGNWGRIYINGVMIFELDSFEAKVSADRDDVIIGQSKDSKIVSLTGEGSFTIKKVLTRGFDKLLKNWQAGYDERFIIVGEIKDPDIVQHQRERVRFENVAIDSLDIMKFSKGEVVSAEIPFKFTPEDVYYESGVYIPNEEAPHETSGGY